MELAGPRVLQLLRDLLPGIHDAKSTVDGFGVGRPSPVADSRDVVARKVGVLVPEATDVEKCANVEIAGHYTLQIRQLRETGESRRTARKILQKLLDSHRIRAEETNEVRWR